ncbi:uncharacterized protein LOC143879737 [Tasmannia lanceolata]|uniref:uncharacterized protein LOC143879737 n=1 Tax=Tasmannia lanceolata TaxID=3420 RepID=UPI004064B729
MGVIKDGNISGVLPGVEAFAVHYPGYPSSTSRAIETLGGIEGIIKTRSSESNYLELRFRPEDPCSHPAFGELRTSTSLLLRISKKDSCGTDRQDAVTGFENPNSAEPLRQSMPTSECEMDTITEDKNVQADEALSAPSSTLRLCADIVARVPQSYHFDGMVDYQHVLAVHADVARRKKRHWADVEPYFEKGGLMDIDQEDLMMLVPPLFSPKDIPENLVLKPSISLNSKQKQQAIVQHHWEMDIEPCIAIDFNIEEIPKKINWENNIPQGSTQWEWQMAVAKLFDERPIWPRRSLQEQLLDDGLKLSRDQLNRLLFRSAYYFATGPFGRFWIRKAYDPRKDSESRIYQRVDFRMPPQLRKFGDMSAFDELQYTWKDICQFRVFPRQSFSSLQFFELDDDYIQQEIRKSSEQTTCAHSTGWFSRTLFECLKLRVNMKFLSVFPKTGAENLVKSVSERFEKSKRLQVLKRDLRPDKDEHQHVNKDSDSQASGVSQSRSNNVEITCDDDDDDEEEEEEEEAEEEEEEEEEEDEYGSLHMADGDDSFSLQASSYPLGENFTKNYLKEIFGSLPFTEEGGNEGGSDGKLQNIDMSDGEYEIYGQDSGDNYFDGDDDDEDDDSAL